MDADSHFVEDLKAHQKRDFPVVLLDERGEAVGRESMSFGVNSRSFGFDQVGSWFDVQA